MTVAVGAEEREEKKAVEEQDRGALGPSADGIDAHRVRGDANDGSQRKDEALRPGGPAAEDDEGRDKNKGQCGQDVRKRERGVGGEESVKRSELRRRGTWRKRKRRYPPDNHGDGDGRADPEADAEPERSSQLFQRGYGHAT